jgi:hypothetical protein
MFRLTAHLMSAMAQTGALYRLELSSLSCRTVTSAIVIDGTSAETDDEAGDAGRESASVRVDALRLRDATERVLSRVHGIPPDRAKVRLDALVDDFRVSAAASQALIDEMVRKGLLHALAADSSSRHLRQVPAIRAARIVEPLPRHAKMMLEHIADLALNFNRTAANNRYEIEVIAVYGAYARPRREPGGPFARCHRAAAPAG